MGFVNFRKVSESSKCKGMIQNNLSHQAMFMTCTSVNTLSSLYSCIHLLIQNNEEENVYHEASSWNVRFLQNWVKLMFQVQTKEMPAWEREPESVPMVVCVRLSQAVEKEDYVAGPSLKTDPYWSVFNIILGPSAAALLLNMSNLCRCLSIRCGSGFWIIAWSDRMAYETMMRYVPVYVSSDKLMIPRSVRGPQGVFIMPISLNGKGNVFQWNSILHILVDAAPVKEAFV